MIDFRLCDLQGVTLKGGDFLDVAGASVTLGVNQGRAATLIASFDDPAAALVRPLSTVLKARWRQGPLFTGVVTRPQYRGASRQVTIPARDPSLRLQSFQVDADFSGSGLPLANNTVWGYAGVDQSEIMARLMDHATPEAQELAAGVPSHGIIRGNMPVTVARDRIYEPGKQIWEAWQQLSAVIDGVDFDLRPLDEEDGTYAALDTYYPQMGSDRSDTVVFEYGWGRENVSDCTIEIAGDVVHNRSVRTGQDTLSALLEERTESLATYGIYSEHIGEPDVILASTLRENALASVTNHAFPPAFVQLTPAQDDGSGYKISETGVLTKGPARYGGPPVLGPQGDYWLGDAVRVVTRDGPAFQFDVAARVLEITLTNTSTGAVVASLTLAPLLGGGYPVRGVVPPSFAREFRAMREKLRLATIVQ